MDQLYRDAKLVKHSLVANATQHQKLGGLKRAAADHHLPAGEPTQSLINNAHSRNVQMTNH